MGCWLIGSFFAKCRYASLCISSLNVPGSFCLFKVSFNWLHSHRLLWNLNVACLTLRPRGENLIFGSINHLLLTLFVFLKSNPHFISLPLFLLSIWVLKEISFPSRQYFTESKSCSVSSPSRNFVFIHQPQLGSAVNMVTCPPSQTPEKASNLDSRGRTLYLTMPTHQSLFNWPVSAILKDLRVLWSHHGVYSCGSGCATL